VVIVASLFERRTAGVYHNTAAVIDADGALLGIYRKMHIPDDPLYFEKFYFTPGDLGFRASIRASAASRAGLLGPVVSGSRAPGRPRRRAGAVLPHRHRLASREKAQYGAAQHDAWRTIQRAHAIANGIYVAAVNRVGFEGPPEHGLEFWGARSWPIPSAR
jgi:N-carbamoylputrescine amidase